MQHQHLRPAPSRWAWWPTRPVRCRSWASPTPTSHGWSSTKSTPRAACSAATSSCYIEDSGTTDEAAEASAAKLVQEVSVDVVFGGILSSTRQAIKGAAVIEGRTLYIYPEQYEGQECDPLIFCTGPVPAQQVDPLIPWLMRADRARSVRAAVGRLHLAARHEREGPRDRHRQRRGDRRGGVLPARPHRLQRRVERIMLERGGSRLQHDRPARLSRRSSSSSTTPASASRGGHLVCTYFDENFLNLVPAEQVEGLYSCLDYYQDSRIRSAASCSTGTTSATPASAKFTGGGACWRHVPRAEAVGGRRHTRPARSTRTTSIEALDHATIADGPGGPAEMVPGQHHVRMNMYIAQVQGGALRTIKRLGAIDPDERTVPSAPLARV